MEQFDSRAKGSPVNWLNSVSLLVALAVLSGCSSHQQAQQELGSGPEQVVKRPPFHPLPPPNKPDLGPHCYKWPYGQLPPLFVAEHGFMITRMTKPCTNLDGEPGYEGDTQWIAMGFPCSGGEGRIEWKGHYYKPKVLSFVVPNSCTMKPQKHELGQLARSTFGFNDEAQLLAYVPFSVQYWELLDFNEADAGFAIELRNRANIDAAWKQVQKLQPLRVRLYGRENTWMKGQGQYQVNALITKTSRTAFSLHVLEAQRLEEEDKLEVVGRCQRFKSPNECRRLFF